LNNSKCELNDARISVFFEIKWRERDDISAVENNITFGGMKSQTGRRNEYTISGT
jgi:hypothetical protein